MRRLQSLLIKCFVWSLAIIASFSIVGVGYNWEFSVMLVHHTCEVWLTHISIRNWPRLIGAFQDQCKKKKWKINIEIIIPGFSIEGGTRRLIAGYFGIYSRLIRVFFFSFLCFVLQVCLSCFLITLPFLACLWSKQNQETCLPFWTWSIKPFYSSAGLHGERWERVRVFQNGNQASPRGAERTY